MTMPRRNGAVDYARLARWRAALRRFLRFSELAARRQGLTASQHQLLLLVRGSSGGPPTIVELAERMQIRHQSVVGLLDRCQEAGLIRRRRDTEDRRCVRIVLTPKAEKILERLSSEHIHELRELRKAFPLR